MTAPPDTAFAATLPTVSFEEVYHVGTLDPADKGRGGDSFEGDGLSVSTHPEDWTRIARLGGNPTWRLTKANNRFIDHHRLTDTQLDTIAGWAETHRWVQRSTV